MIIKALLPNESGHHFVIYGDACAGIPDGRHEQTTAAINRVVRAIEPSPEFICFPGDEIIGLTADPDQLRAQWRHWFEVEMAWLDRKTIPLYHTTGNHTTYDPMSEAIYQEVMAHLPQNGPDAQKGLSYFVRRGDLLMIFVHTLWSGAGGEGFVETEWLADTLKRNHDARHKIVFGHHPVFPVNGFSGGYQREIGPKEAEPFWQILVEHEVFAYVCSHILAFDVQVHDGILQILTAGAGTAHRMPEEIEYLHAIQGCIDETGLRYQVLDENGLVREWLRWPMQLPAAAHWEPFTELIPRAARTNQPASEIVALQFSGQMPLAGSGLRQTLLCGQDDVDALPSFWVGFMGTDNRLAVTVSPQKGRSPHLWHGPTFAPGRPFCFQLVLHRGMGPGGLLWRQDDGSAWHSLEGASAWGLERLTWPASWYIGQGPAGPTDLPFRGQNLQVTHHRKFEQLS